MNDRNSIRDKQFKSIDSSNKMITNRNLNKYRGGDYRDREKEDNL